MASIILLNKPFGILSQFSGDDPSLTLAPLVTTPKFYPAGRLDKDSEGLLLLTDDGKLQHQISDPRFDKEKTYWAQVEGEISEAALRALRSGITLKDGPTRPAKARRLREPELWSRHPPIRERKAIPTSWLELIISEGRNRQVRRMTAAVGFPTLRLIRMKIGEWELGTLQPGESKLISL
ncbi:MAG: pseudouridine synthase [Pseudomonadales bacterium]|nr:pseudouridine synthase [Pseudomonadales bacterium]